MGARLQCLCSPQLHYENESLENSHDNYKTVSLVVTVEVPLKGSLRRNILDAAVPISNTIYDSQQCAPTVKNDVFSCFMHNRIALTRSR